MKGAKKDFTTILIVFIAMKLVDFSEMNILDYLIVVAASLWMIITIIDWFRKGGKNAKG